jgi:hypothetical protein
MAAFLAIVSTARFDRPSMINAQTSKEVLVRFVEPISHGKLALPGPSERTVSTEAKSAQQEGAVSLLLLYRSAEMLDGAR